MSAVLSREEIILRSWADIEAEANAIRRKIEIKEETVRRLQEYRDKLGEWQIDGMPKPPYETSDKTGNTASLIVDKMAQLTDEIARLYVRLSDREEELALIQSVVDGMKPEEKKLLEMRYRLRWPTRQIATHLYVGEKTVRERLQRLSEKFSRLSSA